ncbi:Crp/Fnr family transcriptional regulator [Alsobacter soli]|uniref:Crp/Fnr family transcriptional regulator n=1 Tax=Alsobacter soli TaxID=2109933 RepID=A0A2T1HNK0_9HYPH|nr:Crp/Fnr family transcriptional regulator [Alsobacter soli]PSC03203.1 Crp/Fnr family transcriptional regulator [Alsobacter soli]
MDQRAGTLSIETSRNLLLRRLAPHDRDLLRPHLEPCVLKSRQILHHAKLPMQHVYFIESGLVSVSARISRDRWVEVWLIGSEGMTGIPIVLGDDAEPPLRRIVQVGGTALRLPSEIMRQAMAESASLRRLLSLYVQVVLLQTSQSGACNSHHTLKERLCRWLLLARDGLQDNSLPLTHSVLARLLGVRRPSVTSCLGVLEDMGAIRNTRGMVTITDAHRLEDATCDCHRIITREQRRLLAD